MLKKDKTTKLLPRLFLSLLLVAISLQAAGLLFLACTPKTANALEMNLQVPIPTLNGGERLIKFDGTTGPIADYVQAIYNYAIGIVGVLAAVVMMIGGLMWITAGGNTSNISEAKTMITASLTGLVLVLTSYLILLNVNPALVNLQSSVIGEIASDNSSTAQKINCSWDSGESSGDAEAFVFTKCSAGKTKAPDEKFCSGEKGKDQTCCCQTPTGCINCQNLEKSGFYVSANACCHDTSLCPIILPCQANKALMGKLSGFKDKFTVTGAWPPTPGAHTAGGSHDNGSAVDIVTTGSGYDALQELATELNYAKNKGVGYIQYEADICNNIIKGYLEGIPCVVNKQSSGAHFHVQLN